MGKKVASLRARGLIPAVLYGSGTENTALSLDGKEFKKVWQNAGGSQVIELEMGDNKKNVLIHDVAMDPRRGEPIHVDLYAIRMDKAMVVRVPVVFSGESPAVKNSGGVLVKVIHELEIEALPQDLPSEISVDISVLRELNDHFTVGDLRLKDGVKAMLRPEEVIILVKAPTEETVTEERALEDIAVEKKGKEEVEAEAGVEEKKKA